MYDKIHYKKKKKRMIKFALDNDILKPKMLLHVQAGFQVDLMIADL